ARHALAAGAVRRVMRALLDRGGARAVRRARVVTRLTQHANRLDEQRVVGGAVRIVTAETADAPPVHQALDEVVPLHPILVTGTVREMREGGLPELVLFELPVVFELIALVEPDWPVE